MIFRSSHRLGREILGIEVGTLALVLAVITVFAVRNRVGVRLGARTSAAGRRGDRHLARYANAFGKVLAEG